ncbi:MAG: hypothetical protein ACI4UG_05915 [Candidatus Onthovivens sp.]
MESKEVLLKEENKKDVLEFKITQNLTMQIDLNSKDQTYLRELFYHIISQAFVEDFEFSLSVEQNYKKNLYIEISQEYIKQLNLELKKIIQDIPEKLKSNES